MTPKRAAVILTRMTHAETPDREKIEALSMGARALKILSEPIPVAVFVDNFQGVNHGVEVGVDHARIDRYWSVETSMSIALYDSPEHNQNEDRGECRIFHTSISDAHLLLTKDTCYWGTTARVARR